MRPVLSFTLCLLTLVGCGSKPESTQKLRHFPLTGKITALDRKNQTATVNGSAIPGWMEAMTMEYPIESKTEFNDLQVGDKIEATVDVRAEGEYGLSDIHKQASGK